MPLLDPEPGKLRPRRTEGPAADRVPDERASGTPDTLRADLVRLLGADKVLHALSDLVKYASDASPYRFVPQVVVIAEDVDDVAAVLRYAREHRRAVVFRAAGTSLNGQAQGTDILVDVRRHWTGLDVLDGGRRARIGPGTTVGRANIALSRYGRLMGPDPASSSACTVGGVVANNASGMTAGVTRNSYRLLSSLTLVLPSGTVVDTAAPDADERLRKAEPELAAGLPALKAEIEADPALVARIRAKYELKNTNGYRLDAFLDGSTPVEILRGLMVGSQGTLVFTKFVTALTGPVTEVTLPPGGHTDWEVELVVVLGKEGRHVSEADAWSHVAGLTVGQDISERVLQMDGPAPQFSLGKSYPGFAPTGPWLVTPDEFDDPDDLELTCAVNGEEMQRGRSRQLVFSVPALIARLSGVLPLFPGDLIFTGTPAGVGLGRTPQRWLTAGDELVSSIEGIGELRQRFSG
ncbi:fumarylacetoacetate hydrolase family protein [Streptomyces sp. NPDC008222]|uniref:fumarylacetoacetate hydrolase family protein n=1 Tax=Streptomyces sp. NPDC008222 TaxID=3364820 RepID=UPI0036EECFC1